MAGTAPPRFHTLDGLRGAAAIAVMLFHSALGLMPGAYLAVDFFFALSGFVLAAAYQDRLSQGLSIARFLRLRLVRVWPMAALGALVAVLMLGSDPTMLLLLPAPDDSRTLYPGNAPMWSLFTELVVNALFAIGIVLRLERLMVLVALLCAALTINGILLNHSADFGGATDTLGFALERTIVSFAIGVGIYQLNRRRPAVQAPNRLGWFLPIVLMAALAFKPSSRPYWDLAWIGVLLPALVWFGIQWNVSRSRLFTWLGAGSFPLYCIHFPIMRVVYLYAPELIVPTCFALVPLSIGLGLWIDDPLRRRINAWCDFPVRKQVAI